MTTRNDASRVDPALAVDQRPQGAPSRSTPATPPAVPQPTPAALAALDRLKQIAHEPRVQHFTANDFTLSVTVPLSVADEIVALCESLLAAAARRGAGDTAPDAPANRANGTPSTDLKAPKLPEIAVAYLAGAKDERAQCLTFGHRMDVEIEHACQNYAASAHPEGPQHG